MIHLRRITAVAVLLCCVSASQAEAPKATEPASIKVLGPTDPIAPGLPIFLNTEGVKRGDPYSLFIVPADGQFVVLFDTDDKPVGIYSQTKVGVYTAILTAYDPASKSIVKSLHTIMIGGPIPPTPIPPGPVPPGPTPPVPPGPTPPLPTDKLTVLILEESGARSKLTRDQLAALNSSAATTYLRQHNAEWKHWDDDYAEKEKAFMGPVFKQAYERTLKDSEGKLPWIIISNSKEGTSRPFPENEAALLDLLKRYGGQ